MRSVRVRPSNLVILLALPAVPSAIAPWISSWHWSFDLLACFAVQAMCWLGLAAAALLICRKWRQAAAAAAFSLLAASAIVPGWWPSNSFPQNVGNNSTLRIMTANLLCKKENGHQQLLEVIANAAPDVICCLEYTPSWRNTLRAALTAYPHRIEHESLESFGIAVFSKWPLDAPELLPLHNEWTPAIRATVKTPSGDIGLLGVHPPPPGPSRQRAQDRDLALAEIPRLLATLPPNRIVLGDFNATPWNAPFTNMVSAANLSCGSTTDWLPTWPARLPLPFRRLS